MISLPLGTITGGSRLTLLSYISQIPMLGGLVVSGMLVVVGGVVVVGLVTALHRLFLQKQAVSMSPSAVMLASHCSAVSARRPHLDDGSLKTGSNMKKGKEAIQRKKSASIWT